MTYDVLTRARRTTRRRVTAALLAASVVALAVIAAVGFFTGPDNPSSPGREAPGPSVAPGGIAAEAAALPADLRWAPLAGISVPVSGQSGPRDTSGGLARGFAHDRAGAVLAAVHIVVRVAPQVGASVFDPTLRTQVVGPDAAAMRVQVTQAYDDLRGPAQVAYGQPVGSLYATLRGYRLTSYMNEQATVRLLTEAVDTRGTPARASTEVQMRWTGSDWALVAPTGGTFDHVVAAATDADAATFHPFDPGR